MDRSTAAGLLAAAALCFAGTVARAADAPPGAPPGGAPGSVAPDSSPRAKLEAELRAAMEAAGKALQRGPASIKLGDQGSLQLPEKFGFIPATEGGRVMRAMGNSVGSGFQGMVVPLGGEDPSSFYLLSFESKGYIKDDDAKDWKSDELLQDVRDGTEEGNKRRVAMGIAPVEVTGWVEAPHYQADKHQLVWSIASRDKDAAPGAVEGVNYRTLVLGREGYMTMTLVTDKNRVAALRPATALLLDNLTFGPGKRYADFNSTTDHVAEFGLAALVAGVAAKKIGLIAIIAAFVVKFAKVILVALAGGGLVLRKMLGLGKKAPSPSGAAAGASGAGAGSPTAAAAPVGAPADAVGNTAANAPANTPGNAAGSAHGIAPGNAAADASARPSDAPPPPPAPGA